MNRVRLKIRLQIRPIIVFTVFMYQPVQKKMKQSLRLLAENKDKGYVDDLIREGRTQMVLPKEKCFLLSPREGEDSKRREKNHGRRKASRLL